ncbi:MULTISPECIES: hypothetical protein [unclassified Isoptericola]|uniref:hypothetical protein n=1 Tax=unclassified Isoptericola TaxID=2623355 RepID=UPI00365F4830
MLADPSPVALTVSVENARTIMAVRFWYRPADGPVVTSAVVDALGTALRGSGDAWTVVAPPPAPPLVPRAQV